MIGDYLGSTLSVSRVLPVNYCFLLELVFRLVEFLILLYNFYSVMISSLLICLYDFFELFEWSFQLGKIMILGQKSKLFVQSAGFLVSLMLLLSLLVSFRSNLEGIKMLISFRLLSLLRSSSSLIFKWIEVVLIIFLDFYGTVSLIRLSSLIILELSG